MTAWSPVDGCVLVGLVAAAVVGDELVAPLAGALGACFLVERLRGGRKRLLPARPRMTWRRARDIALVCVTVGVGVVGILPVFYGGTRFEHSPVPLTPWLLASSVIEGVRNSLHQRPSPHTSDPVEYWHAGVKTGVYFLLPRDGDGVEGAVVQVPRDALAGNGAPHAERGPVFRFEEEGTREWVLAGPSSGADGYQFNFTLRRPPGPPVAGRYWLVIRIYRGYDRDPDPERRTSLVEEVTALIDDPQGKATALGR